jgi:hypothetical protein
MVKAFFIQYKFLTPETVKHSSYTYQKLFRALYGYTQNVSKSNGKSYKYHRPGVLSLGPYIRPGKNCVIIPQNQLSPLFEFFKTGRNPTHKWVGKGDWKAVYYMNEKEVPVTDLVKPLEELIDRAFISSPGEEKRRLEEELSSLANSASTSTKMNDAYRKALAVEAQRIVSSEWFALCSSKSDKLKNFASLAGAARKQ